MKKKTIEQGFNHCTLNVKKIIGFFETRVKNQDPQEDKKKSSVASKKKREEIPQVKEPN